MLKLVTQLKTQPIVIVGNKGIESGIALELIKKDDVKILQGLSLNGYLGSRREWGNLKTKASTIGLGINYSAFILPISTGVYVTQTVKDFFDKDNLNFGVGLSIKF